MTPVLIISSVSVLTIAVVLFVTIRALNAVKAVQDSQQETIVKLETELHELTTACVISASMPEGRILEVRGDCNLILGWDASELISENVDVIIPQQFQEGHQTAIEAASEKRQVRSGTILTSAFAQKKDGSIVPVVVRLDQASREPWVVEATIKKQ